VSRLLVVGSGMVGHALVDKLIERGVLRTHELTVVGEEPRLAYDRVHLSACFDGDGAETLALASPDATEAA
jgi:nitrite reductase (NADH) large subunit